MSIVIVFFCNLQINIIIRIHAISFNRMSTTSKFVLGSACAFSAGIIGYVHLKQKIDREKLHEGVIKDLERQHKRKTENLYVLQKQIELTKQLQSASEKHIEDR